MQYISGSLEDAKDVSFHPPHLVLKNGRLLPKALIPFCSYQGIMLGKKIKNWDFVTCNKFHPTVLNGQLCYSLNISQVVPSAESKSGNKNSLLLVLDQPSVLDFVDTEKPMTTIHMNTLVHFSDYRPGKYAMTALKKMTGTEAFMSMSNSEKKCQLESFDNCNKERVLAAFEKECNCYPWLLADYEVSAEMKNFPSFQQDLPICNPSQQGCVARVAEEDHGCLVKCDGLYADVRHMEEDNKISDRLVEGERRLLHMLQDGTYSLNLYFQTTLFLFCSCE